MLVQTSPPFFCFAEIPPSSLGTLLVPTAYMDAAEARGARRRIARPEDVRKADVQNLEDASNTSLEVYIGLWYNGFYDEG